MDHESWVEIEEFPGYAVSNHGRVMNTHTELIKTPSSNQQGIPSVLFTKGGQQFRRALPLLVANYFVPRRASHFDTPINIDGDRNNNHWENLDWRPRWFAHNYHAQFHKPAPYGFKAPVYCVETGDNFADVFHAARAYGVLVKEIIISTHTQSPVFPTWQTFGVLTSE
jgi:NUMOD4 motif